MVLKHYSWLCNKRLLLEKKFTSGKLKGLITLGSSFKFRSTYFTLLGTILLLYII